MMKSPTARQLAHMNRLNKAVGNIFNGTFSSEAYEKAIRYWRKHFHRPVVDSLPKPWIHLP